MTHNQEKKQQVEIGEHSANIGVNRCKLYSSYDQNLWGNMCVMTNEMGRFGKLGKL